MCEDSWAQILSREGSRFNGAHCLSVLILLVMVLRKVPHLVLQCALLATSRTALGTASLVCLVPTSHQWATPLAAAVPLRPHQQVEPRNVVSPIVVVWYGEGGFMQAWGAEVWGRGWGGSMLLCYAAVLLLIIAAACLQAPPPP